MANLKFTVISQSEKYREVYELYQLCSNGKDLKEFCIDAGVNYHKFTEWQRKRLWNEKLGRMEENQAPVMSPVTLTDIPSETVSEKEKLQPGMSIIRYANLQLQDGTSVVIRNTTYEKMLHVFQKLIS